MIKFFLILSVLLSQSIFFLNHIVDEVFGGSAVPSQTQNCTQDAENGDYRYEISNDLNNPTITFIPLNGDAGSTLCLLYYGVGTGTYPGYTISPNVPYQINASQGDQINFYFTYSYNGGERNNAINPHSFIVGGCGTSEETNDATLTSISINNTPLSGFSAQTTSYTYSLTIGETNVPTVSVSTSNTNATYSIANAFSITGTTTITVVSEDTTQTMTYSIAFQQSSYALVWSDEFDDDSTTYMSGVHNAVDDSKWFHQTILPNGWGWYNNEQQHYTNRIQNSYVSDGTLKIVAKKETFNDQGHTKNYTSARLNSKFAFTYGVVEIRAKLPTGVGTWPAFWTLGKNISENGAYWEQQGFGTVSWPACGEIDIMEHWGNNQNFIQSAMHTPSSHGSTVNHGGRSIATVSSQFHVYKLEWTAEKMIFSVDDVEHYTYNPTAKNSDTWPFSFDQYLLLNVAIQESIASSFTSSAMEIDYVRVYQEQPMSIDQSNHHEIQLFPNPTSKRLYIRSATEIHELNIYDLQGRSIVHHQPMQKQFSISEDLPKSIYLVEMKGPNVQSTRRLVIN